MTDIDYIAIRPAQFGWELWVYDGEHPPKVYGISDVFQFVDETERTLVKWIADGPADFHNARAEADATTDAEQQRMDAAIREQEQRLTADLRKLLGRDDVTVRFDDIDITPTGGDPHGS